MQAAGAEDDFEDAESNWEMTALKAELARLVLIDVVNFIKFKHRE